MKHEAKKPEVTREITKRRQDVAVQSWLAEFKALRDEILFRMRNADYSVVINVGALGTILSLGLTINERILLTIPFISSLLGLMYFNQLRHVQILGQYIQNTIGPALSAESHDNSVLGWEAYHRSKKSEWAVIPGWGLINAFAFVVPSTGAVMFTFPSSILSPSPVWIKLVWGVGLLLSIALIWVWYREEHYISTVRKNV